MIGKQGILDRAAEWQLRPDVVEKDYVLGWLLWGIGSEPAIREHWVFKGGTCLKKCYIETYRFSEDLDFTVLEDGPLGPDDVLPILRAMLARVNQESGIDFAVEGPRLAYGPDEGPLKDASITSGPERPPVRRASSSTWTPRRGCSSNPSGDQSRTRTTMSSLTPRRCDATPT